AGSQNVIEVHGSMGRLGCPQCARSYPVEDFVEPFIRQSEIPTCPACGTVLKPAIVLFEEMLPEDAWSEAERHFTAADLVLVVGSSLEVMPAGSLPLYALERGAGLIINTLSETYLDEQADVLLPFDVAATLPAIVAELEKQ
ncbi:MAG TPA: Sir2 family NAD-dependent protein deacetylase, partial [Anaerolineaceae bacterium]|nr:Sir2 family NAD-dependent protein deacetylase [Anaerolineaceae bacterium]